MMSSGLAIFYRKLSMILKVSRNYDDLWHMEVNFLSRQDIEYGRDGCENVFHNPICNASLAFADGQEARLVVSQDGRFVCCEKYNWQKMKRFVNSEFWVSLLFRTTIASAAATAGSLCLELSSQPSDYSYFKSDLMSTWAGPLHWKLRDKLSKG